MGLQCVSTTCDYPMDPNWAFCPACGADNRMPSQRAKVPHHMHVYIQRRGYCTKCGEPIDEPYSFGYRWRVRLALLSLGVGILSLLTLITVQGGQFLPNTPIGRWVNAWYSNPVTHYSRRRYYSSHTYTTLLGNDISKYSAIAAVLFIGLGIMMICKVPFDVSDDDANWRGRLRW